MVEFIALLTGLSASVSAYVVERRRLGGEAGVALEGEQPDLGRHGRRADRRVERRDRGLEGVRRVDRAQAVVDVQATDHLRVVAVGDEQRPAGEAVVARAGLDVRHRVGAAAGGGHRGGDVAERAVAIGLRGRGEDVGGRGRDGLVGAGAGLQARGAAARGGRGGGSAGSRGRVAGPVEARPQDGRASGERDGRRRRVEGGRVGIDVDVAHDVAVVVAGRRPWAVVHPAAAAGQVISVFPTVAMSPRTVSAKRGANGVSTA